MMLDDDIPEMYQFLPGIDKIQRPYREIQADLLVILDASDAERIGAVKTLVKAPTLNIDHHISNTKFANFWVIDDKAAATAEMIYQLLRLSSAKSINLDIAVCLYTAIATDCGFFRYANTTSATLRYAAELIDYGVQPHIISEHMDTRSLQSLILLKKVLETLEFHHERQIAVITVDTQESGGTSESTEGFINYPRNISGVEIAVMLKVIDAKTTRVSMRSKNTDVSKIALAFGGGGHKRAAGCTLNGELSVLKLRLIQQIIQELAVHDD